MSTTKTAPVPKGQKLFEVESYASPQWANAAQTAINVSVTWKGNSAAHPYTAHKNDSEKHGADLFAQIVANQSATPIAPYPLDAAKHRQRHAVRQGAASDIIGGFVSSALGADHTYHSTPTDQANLIASVVASLFPNLPAGWSTPYYCADANGVWALRDHTAPQIQQVFADGKMAVIDIQKQNESLQAKVSGAASVPDVEAVKWQRPASVPAPPKQKGN